MALALCMSISLKAHNPLSATYYVEVKDGVQVLNIYLAQTGVDYALLKQYSKSEIESMSLADYKQSIVDYIKSNFELQADGRKVQLGQGGIKLGSHQTDLKFILSGIDSTTQQLEIRIPAFRENDHHQSVFSFLIYGEKGKVILHEDNDYQAHISIHDGMPFLKSTTYQAYLGPGMLALGLCFGFVFLWIDLQRKEGAMSSAKA